jgi:hypothetical protein
VCIENVLWKKGVAEHTLLGTIRTKTPIESMQLKLDFEDGQKSGSLLLNLRSSQGRCWWTVWWWLEMGAVPCSPHCDCNS